MGAGDPALEVRFRTGRTGISVLARTLSVLRDLPVISYPGSDGVASGPPIYAFVRDRRTGERVTVVLIPRGLTRGEAFTEELRADAQALPPSEFLAKWGDSRGWFRKFVLAL